MWTCGPLDDEPGCGAKWGGFRAVHTTCCHRTFISYGAADRAHKYHIGDLARPVECLDPAARGLVLNDRGAWGYAPPPPGGPKLPYPVARKAPRRAARRPGARKART